MTKPLSQRIAGAGMISAMFMVDTWARDVHKLECQMEVRDQLIEDQQAEIARLRASVARLRDTNNSLMTQNVELMAAESTERRRNRKAPA